MFDMRVMHQVIMPAITLAPKAWDTYRVTARRKSWTLLVELWRVCVCVCDWSRGVGLVNKIK